MKPPQTKPSIVFYHGIWADGSCFDKVTPTVQAETASSAVRSRPRLAVDELGVAFPERR